MKTTRQRSTGAASFRSAAFMLFTLCLFSPAVVRAQWATNGNDINSTNTGNVGVGTSSPVNRVQINNGVADPSASGSATNGFLRFLDGQAGGSRILDVGLGSATTPFAWLQSRDKNDYAVNYAFSLNPNGGKVGVGTTNPASLLHLYSTANSGRMLLIDAKGTSTSQEASLGFLTLGDGTQGYAGGTRGWYLTARGNAFTTAAEQNDLQLYYWNGSTFGGARMYWDSLSGNVGVGTTSPSNALHVHNVSGPQAVRVSGGGGALVNFLDTAAGANQRLYQWRSEGGSFRMSLLNDAENAFVQQNILVANSSGNVGIGTATPTTAKLVIGGAAAGTGLDLASADQYAEMRVVRNSMGAADKDLYLQFQAGAGSKLRLYSNNTETMTLSGGSVGIGTATPSASYKLDVAGDVNASNLNVTGTITGGNIVAKYQDVAEWVPSTQELRAGTVVVLDTQRSNHVMASTSSYDTGVAGVVSAQPGLILGEGGEGKVMVATTGRVKVKVDATRAPVRVGDLLVTSDREGVAMKSVPVDLGGTAIHRPGTIIGKALEPLEKGVGEILVLLSLQ